jgi:hypothetical protein
MGEGHRGDLFAAMPPLGPKWFFVSHRAATWRSSNPFNVQVIEVENAHFNVHVVEGALACIALPEGDREEGVWGRFRKWFYGTRPVAFASPTCAGQAS